MSLAPKAHATRPEGPVSIDTFEDLLAVRDKALIRGALFNFGRSGEGDTMVIQGGGDLPSQHQVWHEGRWRKVDADALHLVKAAKATWQAERETRLAAEKDAQRLPLGAMDLKARVHEHAKDAHATALATVRQALSHHASLAFLFPGIAHHEAAVARHAEAATRAWALVPKRPVVETEKRPAAVTGSEGLASVDLSVN